MTDLLSSTPLLDFDAAPIRRLIAARGWLDLSAHDRIGAAYYFTRNEIAFGYNAADDIAASRVLADGFGQCNTKSTMLMALLRALGIPCRLHGFTIAKSLQRGIVPEPAWRLAPPEILHSWVELRHDDRWIALEGFILDDPVLAALQARFGPGPLCAYGAGTDRLEAPGVDWTGADTFIQATGIVRDFGSFDTPDAFYAEHGQDFGLARGALYRYLVRHWMNARLRAMRRGRIPEIPGGPDPAPRQVNSDAA